MALYFTLLNVENKVQTGDVAGICQMYGADADEVCQELCDFKLVYYKLSCVEPSSATEVDMEAAAAVQDYNDPEVDAADDEGLDAGDLSFLYLFESSIQ